jgi:hypothetical protein
LYHLGRFLVFVFHARDVYWDELPHEVSLQALEQQIQYHQIQKKCQTLMGAHHLETTPQKIPGSLMQMTRVVQAMILPCAGAEKQVQAYQLQDPKL